MLEPASDIFTHGTLRYTRGALVRLFFWLLLGDFCLTMMESALPAMLPLSMRQAGADNTALGVLTTVSGVLVFIASPFVAILSDRHRSPRGRRIPFLIWPTPFVVLSLVLIGFAPQLGNGAHHLYPPVGAATATLWLLVVLVIAFTVANVFINSIYWYVFADVVPTEMMGRFLALLRIVGQLAGYVFGRYIFGWADTHMTAVYAGVALIYGAAFSLMCLNVREGEYPPPPVIEKRRSLLTAISDFARDCFSSRQYVYVYLAMALCTIALASNTYWLFLGRDMLGLSLTTIGAIAAWSSLLNVPVLLASGVIIDRISSTAMVAVATIAAAVFSVVGFWFVRDYQSLLIISLLSTVSIVLIQAAAMPMYIAIFPPERFGQFCSAVGMGSTLGGIVFTPVLGWILDRTHDYRWLLLWRGFFFFAAVPFVLMVIYHTRRSARTEAKTIPVLPHEPFDNLLKVEPS